MTYAASYLREIGAIASRPSARELEPMIRGLAAADDQGARGNARTRGRLFIFGVGGGGPRLTRVGVDVASLGNPGPGVAEDDWPSVRSAAAPAPIGAPMSRRRHPHLDDGPRYFCSSTTRLQSSEQRHTSASVLTATTGYVRSKSGPGCQGAHVGVG